MLTMLRSSDVLARLGGDEFGLLLPDCNMESARYIAGRLIHAINDYHFMWEGRLHRIGASAGITLIDENNHQASEVMSQADIACYASKNSGRGMVTVYEPQQERDHNTRSMMSLDEQWHMIKDNHLMMIARSVASRASRRAVISGCCRYACGPARAKSGRACLPLGSGRA
jgi:predicted signal transduction protein with EAL and GGDEF domain